MPNKLKSHNFAIFCFFGGTRKIVYAKYAGFFRTRREKHNLIKNSDFLWAGYYPSNSRRFIVDIFSITCNALYVIASENTGTPRDTVYPWGEGVCKHKTGDCRLRRLTGQKRSNRGPQKILSYFWGKGVCKYKTGDCRLRRLTGQKRSIRRVCDELTICVIINIIY